jgi:DNA polymerase IV
MPAIAVDRVWCRDCAAPVAEGASACSHVRRFQHDEAFALSIAHLDCDAFYASIEKRDHPELADQPVIVGGGVRGVVTTACYIARRFGVRSAMPMAQARRLCPDGVIVKPRMAAYACEARAIRALMEPLTPDILVASIDEAYLNLTGTARLHGEPPIAQLIRLQNRIEQERGLTVSIGLSYSRYLAKIASELDKPGGLSVLGRTEAAQRLAPMPLRALPGIGPVTAAAMARKGYEHIGDLQSVSLDRLRLDFGDRALWLHDRARGIGPAWPSDARKRQSISAETTFSTDLGFGPELDAQLRLMTERCAARLREAGMAGCDVVLKLKTTRHRLITRRTQLTDPTRRASRLEAAALSLLHREASRTPYQTFRLIGVGVSNVAAFEGETLDVFDPDDARRYAREEMVQTLRDRFGEGALQSGARLVQDRAKSDPKKGTPTS